MDYLVYAYLQSGREADAAGVLAQLRNMPSLPGREFKSGYATTSMPVRYAVERHQWAEAAHCSAEEGTLPWVKAIAVWARAVGLARSGKPEAAQTEIVTLQGLHEQSLGLGDAYWAEQVHIQLLEASAWVSQAAGRSAEAVTALRKAADEEDGIEKRPVTPGPIIPAREQLADLLLEQGQAQQALAEYEAALVTSPGRRGALRGALKAAEQTGAESKARRYRLALQKGN
jgi:tetratricopeptide (TPR) repeat protein